MNNQSSRPLSDIAKPGNDGQPPHQPLLSVEDVAVHFPVKKGIIFDRTVGHVKAVDGVSFQVQRGETFGLVGESGCGKSTLGRALLNLNAPTRGKVVFDGHDLSTLKGGSMRDMRRHIQMVFQDPMASLNPRQNVESLLAEPLRTHQVPVPPGRSRSDQIGDLLETVGLPRSARAKYPHEFSGGQRQRIGIARAIALEPKLVVADEPVSALDVSVQAQVINLMAELQRRLGLTYVVIAHDLAVVRHISDRIGVMYLGRLVEQAPSEVLYERPMHPYTLSLMSAIPIPDPVVEDSRERILLSGDLPSPAAPPSGCRFHTRCPFAVNPQCSSQPPPLRQVAPGHSVACHFAEQIADLPEASAPH